MEFYYNGKLIKKSKTRHYTHGIFNSTQNSVWSCHCSHDAAVKAKNTWLARMRNFYCLSSERVKEIDYELKIVQLEEI